ncbi:Protein translocase subunit YajC [hydrothermal vent metagenome]|uniref:Protein translocase subunit YajC n=1 Tax=hydrothermal vent metagenome TaxID=652676 RepID=A0A3B0V279_9ZZZZ
MNFFISDAVAQTAGAAPTGAGFGSLIPLILIFVVMYFLLIRPQQKKMKAQQAMIAALVKGDEITTNGGVLGKIVSLDESFITVEIAQNVTINLQRGAVANVLPKGTIKSIK